ncbi:MAG: gamma-glutamyltransferase, partial [Mariprofundaceae bacterium]|nr:gamma-glutamyltransferase [Mariprofundaceae bacterium]
MLRAGGNAVDAAVAAVCMSFLAEPVLTGAGGGGFMLMHRPRAKPLLLDSFARMPGTRIATLTAADFQAIPIDFGDTVQSFHIGSASVATPGLLPMLFEVQRNYGRIPMREVLAPAQHAARSGCTLNTLQASFIHLLEPILSSSDGCRALHSSATGLLNAGENFINPELANLLEFLELEGIDDWYYGDIARSIASACQPGGLLQFSDMADARMIERRPLSSPAMNGELLSNPAPSSGGTLIAFSLRLLDELGKTSPEADTILLAESLREAGSARTADFDSWVQKYGIQKTGVQNADFEDQFLSNERIKQHINKISQRLDKQVIDSVTESGNRHGSTTHISVLDGDGMAVSMTTSNGEGSGIVVPGTGIHLNNMLGEEDINPLGFHQQSGGETLSSMMAPSMFLRAHRPAMILGSGGSNRLRG